MVCHEGFEYNMTKQQARDAATQANLGEVYFE
jgi:hypothetical protein